MFKTGIIYSQLKNDDAKYIFKLPEQIYYQYSHYKLRPNICFEFNNYFLKTTELEYFWTIASGIGLNYKIGNKISVNCKIDTDFTPIYVAIANNSNFGLTSYSFNLGFRIEL